MAVPQTKELSVFLEDEQATLKLGKVVYQCAERIANKQVVTIYLHGNLGMGKTTFCRGVLNAAGYSGKVKSPTYTLVEPYEVEHVRLFHFDLYRVGDPEELEFMGIRDYFELDDSGEEKVMCLVEWPEKGKGILAKPLMSVHFELQQNGRQVTLSFSENNEMLNDQFLDCLQTKLKQELCYEV